MHEHGAGSLAGAVAVDYGSAFVDPSFDDNDG
jgi:hypothetical protein